MTPSGHFRQVKDETGVQILTVFVLYPHLLSYDWFLWCSFLCLKTFTQSLEIQDFFAVGYFPLTVLIKYASFDRCNMTLQSLIESVVSHFRCHGVRHVQSFSFFRYFDPLDIMTHLSTTGWETRENSVRDPLMFFELHCSYHHNPPLHCQFQWTFMQPSHSLLTNWETGDFRRWTQVLS